MAQTPPQVTDDNQTLTPLRALRRSGGLINKKDLCIWCMKGKDQCNPDREKFYQILELKAWTKFKASIMYVNEPELKLRLQTFVDSTPDPFATEVWYHDI